MNSLNIEQNVLMTSVRSPDIVVLHAHVCIQHISTYINKTLCILIYFQLKQRLTNNDIVNSQISSSFNVKLIL